MSYMDYNLNSCPFCSANVKDSGHDWLSHDKHHSFSISCFCGAFGPKKDSKEKAIMAWNTRPYSAQNLFWNPFDFHKDTDGMDIKGNLGSLSFSSILQILSTENKTGILQLSHGQRISAICLKEGRVIAASSNYGQQLGQILFNKGLVSLEKLQSVLDNAKLSGKRLGETLLEMGYVSQDALKSVIREQINETIQGLVLWEEGVFQYRDCSIEFDERGIEDTSIMGIMLNALIIADEMADTKAIDSAASFQEIKIV